MTKWRERTILASVTLPHSLLVHLLPKGLKHGLWHGSWAKPYSKPACRIQKSQLSVCTVCSTTQTKCAAQLSSTEMLCLLQILPSHDVSRRPGLKQITK